MREIKFKAWDKINKKMLSWEEIWEQDLVRGIFEYDSDYIPLQYTGQQNIYVGDIVEVTEPDEDSCAGNEFKYKCEVCFGGGEYKSSFTLKNSEFYKNYALLHNDRFYIKLVGNIYEGLKIDL